MQGSSWVPPHYHPLPLEQFYKRNTVEYLLHVDLNVLLQVVAIEVEYEVMNKIETVRYDDERKLICQFGLLWVEGVRVCGRKW